MAVIIGGVVPRFNRISTGKILHRHLRERFWA
jgi:hypothetical protein